MLGQYASPVQGGQRRRADCSRLGYRMRMRLSEQSPALLPLALEPTRNWLCGPRRNLGAVLACTWLLLGGAPVHAVDPGQAPQRLLIRVRDSAPGARPNFMHERDRSYTVSTGAGEDRDERVGTAATNNATVVSTSTSVRLLRVLEGEAVRVDLPSLQTLQFHVPLGNRAASTHASGGAAASSTPGATSGAAGASAAGTAGGSASGVVYFEAVSAFAARFALVGSNGVRIELEPLQAGGVAAPFAVAPGGQSVRAVTLLGRVGEWIALGDNDLVTSGKSLTATAQPPSQPTVWVRVEPDSTAHP